MCLNSLPLAGRDVSRCCPPTLIACSVPFLIAVSTDFLVLCRSISVTSWTVKKYEAGKISQSSRSICGVCRDFMVLCRFRNVLCAYHALASGDAPSHTMGTQFDPADPPAASPAGWIVGRHCASWLQDSCWNVFDSKWKRSADYRRPPWPEESPRG